jgi:vacuolar-type H+-ATPase subunit H
MSIEGQSNTNETRSALDGYQIGITEVLEKELQQMKEDTEKESARIIAEAKKQVQVILDQAEQKARQEAKEKTRYEVESLLAGAQEEAKKAVAEIKHNALQRSHNIVAIAQQQGEKAARKTKEEATKVAEDFNKSSNELKREAEKEAEEIREKASKEANQIISDAIEAARVKVSGEESKILDDSEQLAELINDEASSKIKEILEEAVRAVNEAKQKFSSPVPIKKSNEISEEPKPLDEKPTQPELKPEITQSVTPQLEVPGTPQGIVESKPLSEDKVQPEPGPDKLRYIPPQPEVPATTQAQSDILYGSIELQVTDGADTEELAEWTKSLRNIPLLRVLSMEKTASEQGSKFLILTDAPTPLIGILKKMSSVKEVRKENDKLLVTLSGRGPRYKATSQTKTNESK